MKPSDVYALEPESTLKDLSILIGCYYNHIPEIAIDQSDLQSTHVIENNYMVEIKIIKQHNFDYRRYWRLATVWYEGKPVMITQNAGREGDDFSKRFITDVDAYKDMLNYIKRLLPIQFSSYIPDIVLMNDEVEDLDRFYGNELRGYFY